MEKRHLFLMVGCDDNGIHTEAFCWCDSMVDAVVAFALKDAGPIRFMVVAEGLRDAGEINSGDLAVLEGAKDTGKIDVGEIARYQELVTQVNERVADIASQVFNFGQLASDDYDGRRHQNYVDGSSVSLWKIYDLFPESGVAERIYPEAANTVITATACTIP